MLLAFGGIISALTLICLFLCSVLTFNTAALLCLSSVLIGTMVIEGGFKRAILCYLTVSILSLILAVDKTVSLAFILFFGYYPILKALIEKINRLYAEIAIKFILFLTVSFVGVYGYSELFAKSVSEVLPLWAAALAVTLFFGICDYVLSIVFDCYMKKIRPKLRK